MELIYPSYYKAFKCIASACPDSCCHEWDVQVDPEAAARYQALQSPLGDALRAVMYEDDGETYLRNEAERCPMWRQDGLCRIQAELGHGALCRTCREFPRLRQDYGDFLELGLELSCPEAARIILSEEFRLVSATAPGGDEPDYDPEVMSILRTTRPEAMALLHAHRFSVPERLALLLMYGYHVQTMIDSGEAAPFDPDAALAEARSFAGAGDVDALLDFFSRLEVLTHRWSQRLTHPNPSPEWHEELCKLAEYGLYRYYYQAVCDYDLVCRIKLIVTLCVLTARLADHSFGSLLDTAQLCSKEIENDAENIDAILDGAYTSPALTDTNLLGLLLT